MGRGRDGKAGCEAINQLSIISYLTYLLLGTGETGGNGGRRLKSGSHCWTFGGEGAFFFVEKRRGRKI